MSQKAELPSLTGHRTKTRKRDEKKVNDPTGFRDSVVEGLSNTGVEGSDITETEVRLEKISTPFMVVNLLECLGRS